MAIKTSNIPDTKENKVIQPGNNLCTIYDLELAPWQFKENAYHIYLYLMGPDLGPEFEGFLIDKDNPESGRFAGQIGKVRATDFAFSDAVTKFGKIVRDNEILAFVKRLCVELKCLDWLETQDDAHETIEDLMKQFRKDAPWANIPLNFCLAGKEYKNDKGYDNFDLFLPKFTKTNKPVEALDARPSRLIIFDNAKHIVKSKKKAEVVDGFTTSVPAEASKDFDI